MRTDIRISQVENCLSQTVLFSNFPAMWYGIIPPMLVLCNTTWVTGRSLVHLVPEGQRSTERVCSIYRWYGSIPHGASGILIGPRHRNRHVTCGNCQYVYHMPNLLILFAWSLSVSFSVTGPIKMFVDYCFVATPLLSCRKSGRLFFSHKRENWIPHSLHFQYGYSGKSK